MKNSSILKETKHRIQKVSMTKYIILINSSSNLGININNFIADHRNP